MSRFECVDFKVSLSPYLDGELDRDTRTRADRHLLECRECRNLLERAERQDASFREAFAGDELETGPLPAGFERSVFAAIEGRPTGTARAGGALARLRSAGWPLAAAASVALAVTATSFLRTPPTAPVPMGVPAATGGPAAMPAWPFLASARISGDDVHALHATGILLGAIEEMPFEDAAARERLRQIALYDDLLDRLSVLSQKLDPAARRDVDAARSALFVLLRDDGAAADSSVESAKWSALQEDLRMLELPKALERLSAISDIRLTL
jgi:hypothetical protein